MYIYTYTCIYKCKRKCKRKLKCPRLNRLDERDGPSSQMVLGESKGMLTTSVLQVLEHGHH